MYQSPGWVRPVALAAVIFGFLTIFSGGMALFGGAAAKTVAGDAVPIVLWFNFLAGFVYVLGAVALFRSRPWARRIAWGLAVCTLVMFAILIALALSGTPFEWRTMGAMTLRSGFWLVIAIGLSKSA